MFTMEEYIREKGLGVSHRDPAATHIIAKHLREQGYVNAIVRKGGSRKRRWFKPEERPNYAALKEKLNEIPSDN